jgi:transcriptional regulator with XRE-family HTH domain
MSAATIGSALAGRRRDLGLEKGQAAKRIGMSRTTYSSYEQDAQRPSVDVFPALADFLNVSVEELLALYGATCIAQVRSSLGRAEPKNPVRDQAALGLEESTSAGDETAHVELGESLLAISTGVGSTTIVAILDEPQSPEPMKPAESELKLDVKGALDELIHPAEPGLTLAPKGAVDPPMKRAVGSQVIDPSTRDHNGSGTERQERPGHKKKKKKKRKKG